MRNDNDNWSGLELLIKPSAVKAIAKKYSKRTGKDFLVMLNTHVHKKLAQAIAEHNGGKKTLDGEVGAFIGLWETIKKG